MLLFILAQAAAAAAPVTSAPAQIQPPAAASEQQPGVTSYPPEFFAEAHPNTANDMVGFLPGFSLDTGSGSRGYEGSAGNVLINGQRPVTKTDNLNNLLARILASQVERIDVIRGGAPGIDMMGKTVIANVITKHQNGARGVFH
ncbi:MAG: TonB-dependent receptor, partial [Proteobacteria bacterium]|nr:TonB-dependent receptor [Pseudomonadota bacterium]